MTITHTSTGQEIVKPVTVFLIALLLIFSPRASSGQKLPIDRGAVSFGGTAAFFKQRDVGNDYATTTLEVLPKVGYFVVRGLAVNMTARYRYIWYDDRALVRDQSFSEWGVGPGLTYYIKTRSPKVYPFLSARTLLLRAHQQSDIYATPQSPDPVDDNRAFDSRNTTWQGAAGLVFMVVKHVGITGEAYYQHSKVKIQPGETNESSNSAKIYGLQFGVLAFVY